MMKDRQFFVNKGELSSPKKRLLSEVSSPDVSNEEENNPKKNLEVGESISVLNVVG